MNETKTKKMKTVHYVDGDEVDEEDLADYYNCGNCGTNIKDAKYGFREDAYGNYYCEDDQDCLWVMVSEIDHVEYDSEEVETDEEEE